MCKLHISNRLISFRGDSKRNNNNEWDKNTLTQIFGQNHFFHVSVVISLVSAVLFLFRGRYFSYQKRPNNFLQHYFFGHIRTPLRQCREFRKTNGERGKRWEELRVGITEYWLMKPPAGKLGSQPPDGRILHRLSFERRNYDYPRLVLILIETDIDLNFSLKPSYLHWTKRCKHSV